MMQDKRISVLGHLDELRSRLIKSVFAVVVMAVGVYHFKDTILSFLASPVDTLVFITPTEAFVTSLKVAIWGGMFAASPIIIYQLWRFVASGLTVQERKYTYIFMPASFLLFVTGALFGFFVIIKFGMRFLLSYGADYMTPMLSVSKYISFLSSTVFAFGIVFQLPLVMFFLAKIGLITTEFLMDKRRYAIVLIFLCAGALTPGPDIFSQMSMAIPLLGLYEAGILMTKFTGKSSSVRDNQDAMT